MTFVNQSTTSFSLEDELHYAKKAENIGLISLFMRDTTFIKKGKTAATFGYNPFVNLSHLAAHTKKIALGTGSIVTTLLHPVLTAKAAATFDLLSQERLPQSPALHRF
ncbi:LLM class flavin-dependent oxidoreductase [Lysinibacillus sp. NPDC097287]|uniref:LLM class flavin-dependent oxidoreductase n=1 Tax=Lysinibacillus sp. NPDC097287 TaxID=3364144 RepID=UPI0038016F54